MDNYERLSYIERRLNDYFISGVEAEKLFNEKKAILKNIEEEKSNDYVNKACKEFCDYVKDGVKDYFKNHHLRFEISVAWDDDNEFEHEGYYDSVDEAINALENYRNYPNIL